MEEGRTLKPFGRILLSGDSQILVKKAKANFLKETKDKGEFTACRVRLQDSGGGDLIKLEGTDHMVHHGFMMYMGNRGILYGN